jgi:hypothetical protein
VGRSTLHVDDFIAELIKDPFKFTKEKPTFSLDQLKILTSKFIKQEQSKSNLVRLNDNFNDVIIVGDLHGDLKSAVKITRAFLNEEVNSIVFLGDYVDRGENSLVVLFYLICLSIAWPSQIQMLKGNHEHLDLNRRYGFQRELREIFPTRKDYDEVIQMLDKIYNNLSLCAITPNLSFCCHGGVPNDIDNLGDFDLIPKPHSDLSSITDIDLQMRLLAIYQQINWNDPVENQEDEFDHSYRGYDIYTFNETATSKFLKKINCKRIVRAHESSRGGFQYLFRGKLLHIFSSQPYFGKIHQAYILHEDIENKILLRKLNFQIEKQIS